MIETNLERQEIEQNWRKYSDNLEGTLAIHPKLGSLKSDISDVKNPWQRSYGESKNVSKEVEI